MIWTDLRWRRRLATLRCGVPLPGGRRVQVRDTFNGMARDFTDLWPLLVATAACVGVASTRVNFNLSPADCVVLTLAFGMLAVAIAYAIVCLLWRHRILPIAIYSVAVGGGCGGAHIFITVDRVSVLWSLPVAALALLGAFAADRVARRRELEREWG